MGDVPSRLDTQDQRESRHPGYIDHAISPKVDGKSFSLLTLRF
jgi:hypothetical protein